MLLFLYSLLLFFVENGQQILFNVHITIILPLNIIFLGLNI